MAKVGPTMAVERVRDTSNLGVIDYGLMGMGSSLAVWSAGMAIGESSISIFSSSLVLLGTVVSFLVRSLAGASRWLKVDAVLYTLTAAAALFFIVPLQAIMPEGGFPREVFAAGFLSWMLILGSFVTWRDSTLLFQAVPSIAMFGLVGCYDTFRDVVFLFYGFLLCLVTFFARAHRRMMLHQAASSGYFARGLAPGAPEPVVEVTPGLAERMREGPWRWVAGPEWALGSALLIVLFSFIGTPVIRSTVQEVTGFVRVGTPALRTPSTVPSVVNPTEAVNVRVGRGPVELTDKPVLEATLDRPRYLRNATYDAYNPTGSWSSTLSMDERSKIAAAVINLMDSDAIHAFDFRIDLIQRLRRVPVPGEPITTPSSVAVVGDVVSPSGWGREISGRSVEVSGITPQNRPDALPPAFDTMSSPGAVSQRVLDLARQVTEGKTTDYDRAMAIKHEIERRVKYNINAGAIPDGEDAVEYLLFTQKEAYCDLFATAMVVMCRAVGIPARYATGFLTHEETSLGSSKYLIRERDAHAWAEVLFDRVGWVVFDATEGAESVDGAGVGSGNDGAWYRQRWFLLLLDVLIIAVPLGALGVYLWKQRQRALHPDYPAELDRLYLRFTSAIRRASGIRRQVGMTSQEYMQAVEQHLGGHASSARALSDAFEQAYYAPGTIGRDKLASLTSVVERFERDLRGKS